MKKKIWCACAFILAFILWTTALCLVDVKAIGPNDSSVGFATVNGYIHNLTGVHMSIYNITDWLGLVPLAIAMGFAVFGLCQWIKRKNILKVDFDILLLGGFYIAVIAVYILLETYVVNYRPVLINGFLEASYPSSTTLLVMTVMPTAVMQMKYRVKNRTIRIGICFLMEIFTIFMVVGRTICGVHWLSDIIGGALVSSGLVMLYNGFFSLNRGR